MTADHVRNPAKDKIIVTDHSSSSSSHSLVIPNHHPLQPPSSDLHDDVVHIAARYGTADAVEQLVADVGVPLGPTTAARRGSVGATPAHDAAAAGNMGTMMWLMGRSETEP